MTTENEKVFPSYSRKKAYKREVSYTLAVPIRNEKVDTESPTEFVILPVQHFQTLKEAEEFLAKGLKGTREFFRRLEEDDSFEVMEEDYISVRQVLAWYEQAIPVRVRTETVVSLCNEPELILDI